MAEVEPGQEFLERYELFRELGVGGMGAVYLARDRRLGRDVAAKFLLGEGLGEDVLDRFFEEAKSLSSLRHPNVLEVFDYGDRFESPYITMEYVKGESVAQAIARRGALPIEQVLAWGEQLCCAMEAVHSKGILHRDLKGENLMVNREGVLKVMDFGLARRDDRAQELTAAGVVMGTPGYMAPEIVMGEQASVRTDLYAAGVLLF